METTFSMETTSSMETIHYDVRCLILNSINYLPFNKESRQIQDENTCISLKNKLKEILSDENTYFDELNCKEIYSLATLFIKNIYVILFDFSNKQIFSLEKLKEALLNPTKKLFLSNDEKFLAENTSNDNCVLYINPIEDDHFNFQLKLIFYSCYIMKRKGDIILHFKFSNNDDDDNKSFGACVKTIIRSLKLNLPLTTISFYKIYFGNFIPNAFAKALKQNTTLLELNIVYGCLTEYNIKSLATVLKKNKTLTKLNLSKNYIYNGTESIAYALKDNTTLLELDLSFNHIGYKGIKRLAMKGLTENTTLKILNLNNNLIGSHFTGGDGYFNGIDYRISGTKWINDFLSHWNKTLTTLSLDYNIICTRGAKEIAYALKNNTTLTTLSLAHNSICLDGAIALVEALKENNTLEIIDLSDNNIDEGGREWLRLILREFAFNCSFIY